MLHFILLHHTSWPDLGLFPRNVMLWLSKGDLRDSSSWSSPPILLLRDIHVKLLTQYDCKEVCAPPQSQVNVGASVRLCSLDDVSQQQGDVPLSLPQLNRLFETSFVRDESSVSNADVYPLLKSGLETECVSSCLSWWVGWHGSGLTVEMKPGLLIFDRLSFPWPWTSRSRSSLKRRWRLVVAGSSTFRE